MKDLLKKEGKLLWKAAKKTRIDKIPPKLIFLELLANGIAAIVAYVVYGVLQLFFKVETPVDTIGRLFGIKSKRILVDENTFEWFSWILIVLASLIAFTYVERVLENYFKERSEASNGDSDDEHEKTNHKEKVMEY